jgi:hypothetical protein
MKRVLGVLGVFALAMTLAGPRSVAAAELKVLEPADHSLVKGTVTIKVKPEMDEGEKLASYPEIAIQNEKGEEVMKVAASADTLTGVTTGSFSTLKLPDGLYTAVMTYKISAALGATEEQEQDLTLGVRNGAKKPARFVVELAEKPYKGDDVAEVTVRVYDQTGMLMPGARVAFKTDKGEVDSDAEITDSTGEVHTAVDSEETVIATLTITVEDLPAVKKVIRFVE